MTPDKQRIALAEFEGWKSCRNYKGEIYCDDATEPGYVETNDLKGTPPKGGYLQELPDYLSSLDAMHEAEKTLTDEQFNDHYMKWLVQPAIEFDKAYGCLDNIVYTRACISATASQRAEAFLRTIGKWTEE